MNMSGEVDAYRKCCDGAGGKINYLEGTNTRYLDIYIHIYVRLCTHYKRILSIQVS
jgi:hypothetical protein